ncbi:TPA: hypothetical protein I8Y25_004680 [Raoultella ornithinolytica]|nr:hypothetical protein [Raoultella ornithinolytica]HAT1614827.1 hypothetical protein [Raoultella ornithinolytica]
MRVKVYCLSALLIVVLLIIFYYFKPLPSNKGIACQSRHTLIHDDFRLDSNIGFTLGNYKGELTIYGIAAENGRRSQISRVINFTYVNYGNIYFLKNQHVENMSTDSSKDSSVDTYFPAFFYEPGKEMTIKIEYDKYRNPLIYFHNMPTFYCKKYQDI